MKRITVLADGAVTLGPRFYLCPGVETLKTPDEWAAEGGIRIYDPDGWRHSVGDLPAKDYDEPISEDEFGRRLLHSTASVPPSWVDKERARTAPSQEGPR